MKIKFHLHKTSNHRFKNLTPHDSVKQKGLTVKASSKTRRGEHDKCSSCRNTGRCWSKEEGAEIRVQLSQTWKINEIIRIFWRISKTSPSPLFALCSTCCCSAKSFHFNRSKVSAARTGQAAIFESAGPVTSLPPSYITASNWNVRRVKAGITRERLHSACPDTRWKKHRRREAGEARGLF